MHTESTSASYRKRDFLRLGLQCLGGYAGSMAISDPEENTHSKRNTYIRFSREAMHTDFQVMVSSRESAQTRRTCTLLLDEIDRIEAILTIWQSASELIEVNRRAFKVPVKVGDEIFAMIRLAKRIHAETAGAYDISIAPLIRCWGFHRRQGCLPTETARIETFQCVGMQHIELDEFNHTVSFKRAGMELSPASMGKGLALDYALRIAPRYGLENVLLNGGYSSVLASGAPPGCDGWWVAIRGTAMRVCLCNRALSTSGNEAQRFRVGEKVYGHILDPRIGSPVESDIESVHVAASSAAEAEAYSTAFYVLGESEIRRFCEKRPDISVLIVRRDASSDKTKVVVLNWNENDVEVITTS